MSSEEAEKTNFKKRKFKQTRRLIKLAIDNGLTQDEIAKLCRTQQSVVSDWKNGKKLGTEQQLKPLLERFGYKLRRNSFKLYRLKDQGNGNISYHKVEGTLIYNEIVFDESQSNDKKRPKPIIKISIHHQGDDNFRIIELTPESVDKDKNNHGEELWTAHRVSPPKSSQELITCIDNYSEHIRDKHLEAALRLPFKLRHSLLSHGFIVGEIVEYPAKW